MKIESQPLGRPNLLRAKCSVTSGVVVGLVAAAVAVVLLGCTSIRTPRAPDVVIEVAAARSVHNPGSGSGYQRLEVDFELLNRSDSTFAFEAHSPTEVLPLVQQRRLFGWRDTQGFICYTEMHLFPVAAGEEMQLTAIFEAPEGAALRIGLPDLESGAVAWSGAFNAGNPR